MTETVIIEKKKNGKLKILDAMGKLGDEKKALIAVDAGKTGDAEALLDGLKNLEVNVVLIDEKNMEAAYEAADLVVIFKKDDSKIMRAWANGTVPVCLAGGNVSDYDPVREEGNAYIAKTDNEWGYFEAVVRALESYKFPYDWKHLVQLCLKEAA